MKWGSPHFRVKFEIPPVLRDSTEIGLATPSLIASPAFWMALSVCILEVDACFTGVVNYVSTVWSTFVGLAGD